MKRLDLRILTSIIHDVEDLLSVQMSRDISTAIARYEAEGPQFLTIALPRLDDLLTVGLSSGLLPEISGWKTRGRLPEFLSPLWRRIFRKDGYLCHNPDVDAIIAIRQITRVFKKQFVVCPDRYVESSLDSFKQTDDSISWDQTSVSRLRGIFKLCFGSFLNPSLSEVSDFHHGPGAVAGREDSVAKYDFSYLPTGFSEVFDGRGFNLSYSDFFQSSLPEQSPVARLIAVPKVANKPRLISIESSVTMFLQQGIEEYLAKKLSGIWTTDYTTSVPNQELSRLGSVDGSFATIDLSEASDRIGYGLVRELFQDTSLWEYLDVSRSKAVEMPGGDLFQLKKFASMGSCCTFPIQIMVFTAIAVMALIDSGKYKSVGSVFRSKHLRVFGDDIVLPTHSAKRLIEYLTQFGLKVNTQKSFLSGLFRESCGSDWYAGQSVKPIYFRGLITSERYAETHIAWLSFRNQLYALHRYPGTVALMDKLLEHYNLSVHNCLANCVDNTLCGTHEENYRWNSHLQRREYRALLLKERRRRVSASSLAKTLFALNHIGSEPPTYDPLAYNSRPNRLKISVGWRA